MDFEDLQVIWDSQKEQPMYGVNESGLRDILREKSRKFGVFVFWQEIQTFGATFTVFGFVFMIFLADYGSFELFGNSVELANWEIITLLLAAGLWVRHTFLTYLLRKKQKRRERRSMSSLKEYLNREIEHTEEQIWARTNPRRGFALPYSGAALLMLVWLNISGVPLWGIFPIIAVLVPILFWESRHQERHVTNKILPRKKELESLRDKLNDPNHYAGFSK
jgi:hypothetical protein